MARFEYEIVYTPHIAKIDLWETSGHTGFYRESMFDTMDIDGQSNNGFDGPIQVIALGSPHFSIPEFEALMPLVRRDPPKTGVEFFVCTHRLVHATLAQRGWLEELAELGVEIVVDTCVVVTPIVRARQGTLMTNSGKFAHYTPGNLGLGVVYGSLEECVRSAAAGRVWRDADLWSAP